MLQDAGDFHKSAHLKVGGLRHTGEGDEGNRRGGACHPRPSVVADTPTAPRIPVASREAAHTTQASQLQWCPWPQKLGSSSKTLWPCPSCHEDTQNSGPQLQHPDKPARAETPDPSYPSNVPHSPKSHSLPSERPWMG